MDVFPKYIVEGDRLVMAKCTYHYQIAEVRENVKGGGWWRHGENNDIIFYSDSHDFGQASLEDVQECFKAGKVFTDKYECRNVANKWTFYYDTGSEKILLLSPPPTDK